MCDELKESGAVMFPNDIALVNIDYVLQYLVDELLYANSASLELPYVPTDTFDTLHRFLKHMGFDVDYNFETFSIKDIADSGYNDSGFIESFGSRTLFVVFTSVSINHLSADVESFPESYFKSLVDSRYRTFKDSKEK